MEMSIPRSRRALKAMASNKGRPVCLRKYVFSALLMLPILVVHADTAPADAWAPVRFMVGRWNGTVTGQAGDGTVTRQYGFVLKDRFIRESNTSTYPPQAKNKKGEVHEHTSYLSYDKARKQLVIRQFHVESFVIQYAMTPSATTQNKVVFDSESFENLNSKWRARETYDILGPDEFTETFEISEPGKPFEVYSRNHFRRAAS